VELDVEKELVVRVRRPIAGDRRCGAGADGRQPGGRDKRAGLAEPGAGADDCFSPASLRP
jgi:hypothetical protein